ncbi:unnamed protein product [Camellia sinensis]
MHSSRFVNKSSRRSTAPLPPVCHRNLQLHLHSSASPPLAHPLSSPPWPPASSPEPALPAPPRALADSSALRHADFSTFNHYLTVTHLAAEINRRTTITICAVDNAAMSDLLCASVHLVHRACLGDPHSQIRK